MKKFDKDKLQIFKNRSNKIFLKNPSKNRPMYSPVKINLNFNNIAGIFIFIQVGNAKFIFGLY